MGTVPVDLIFAMASTGSTAADVGASSSSTNSALKATKMVRLARLLRLGRVLHRRHVPGVAALADALHRALPSALGTQVHALQLAAREATCSTALELPHRLELGASPLCLLAARCLTKPSRQRQARHLLADRPTPSLLLVGACRN